jgi:hypothetical protein
MSLMGVFSLTELTRNPALCTGWLALILALLMVSCRSDHPNHSPLFRQLFRSDTAAFRGVDPGDPIQLVLRQEDRSHLLHQDELGLAYRLPVEGMDGKPQEMLIDYLSDNLRTEKNTNRIASIVVNLRLGDEVATTQLYEEVFDFLNQTYGVASGRYGNHFWEGLTRHSTRMEIHLRMTDNKRDLTLNFVDTEPEPDDARYSGIELDSMGRPRPLRLIQSPDTAGTPSK